MFKYFFEIPADVSKAHIFPELELKDILSLDLVSHAMHASVKNYWGKRIQKDFGMLVSENFSLELYPILYLFFKGFDCFDPYTENKTLKKLSSRYFSQVIERINKLTLTADTDKSVVFFMYGFMHFAGKGFEKNVDEGINYLTQSSNLGNTKAKLALAYYYLKDLGLNHILGHMKLLRRMRFLKLNVHKIQIDPTDLEKGKALLFEAFKKNDPEAIALCAHLSQGENGDPQIEAIKNEIETKLESSAKTDSQCALLFADFSEEALKNRLSNLTLEEGISDPQLMEYDIFESVEQTIYKYQIAAQLGSIHAIRRLVYLHLGGHGIPETLRLKYIDKEKGIEMMKHAAKIGNVHVALDLGRLFFLGKYTVSGSRDLEVEKNIKKAIKFFEFGATKYTDGYDLSHVKVCILELINVYLQDDLVIENDKRKEQLLKWCNYGIELGIYECLMEMGYLHLYGMFGFEKNAQLADTFFRRRLAMLPNASHDAPDDFTAEALRIRREIETHYSKVKANPQIAMQHYLIWLFREVALGGRQARIKFELRYLLCEKNPFNSGTPQNESILSICLEYLESGEISLEDIRAMAKKCYEALDLPVFEDAFLLHPERLRLEEDDTVDEQEHTSSASPQSRM